jgi:spore maturation protein CgeB
MIDRYLNDEDERTAVAMAGQARTHSTHTFRRRVDDILQLVGKS